jgi:hypothetical protein
MKHSSKPRKSTVRKTLARGLKKTKKATNSFFKLMLDAKKKNLPSFKYKSKTYKGVKHPNLGMVYRKA